MTETQKITPADRATAVFDPGPDAALRCSHCGDMVSDADAECPTCDSPLDWGASSDALRAWQEHEAGGV
jgi:rubrerythrin